MANLSTQNVRENVAFVVSVKLLKCVTLCRFTYGKSVTSHGNAAEMWFSNLASKKLHVTFIKSF